VVYCAASQQNDDGTVEIKEAFDEEADTQRTQRQVAKVQEEGGQTWLSKFADMDMPLNRPTMRTGLSPAAPSPAPAVPAVGVPRSPADVAAAALPRSPAELTAAAHSSVSAASDRAHNASLSSRQQPERARQCGASQPAAAAPVLSDVVEDGVDEMVFGGVPYSAQTASRAGLAASDTAPQQMSMFMRRRLGLPE
jgi:hypothetical protein